ncbi:hypothetical protein EJB05_45805, partial [Eragrostis curvula]
MFTAYKRSNFICYFSRGKNLSCYVWFIIHLLVGPIYLRIRDYKIHCFFFQNLECMPCSDKK